MRVFQNANYPFMQWRRRAYIITALLFVVGFAAMAMNVGRYGTWLNYGVDFTGGTLVQVQFQRPVTVDAIRDAARAGGHSEWEITRFGTGNEYVIRMPTFRETAQETSQSRVLSALNPAFGNDVRVTRTEAVGPKVGDELQMRALYAILLSLLATLVYLWFRFEWRFGLAAIGATGHDLVITLGVIALMRQEVGLGTVAALLTVVGYSLNDTIVVFDRIRENLAKPRHGASFTEILNRSINETLPRTVLTGGSTMGTLLALIVFGGPVIRDFAVVLLLGIFIGTFSSIFVASPLLNAITGRWPHKAPTREQAARSSSRGREAARVRV
ncbi:MAG TPA: protein translocase subunit SecF [Longimicrobium sp.]|jgi:preprotein translocase subunit SecF